MTSRPLIVGATFVGGLAALVGMLYAIVASEAESRFVAGAKEHSRPDAYTITVTSYARGWRTSTATTVIKLDGRWKETYQQAATESHLPVIPGEISLRHTIHHGPVIANGGSVSLHLARVESVIDLPPLFGLIVAGLFSGQPLLEASTTVGIDGTSYTRFSSPGYTGPLGASALINYGGVDGYLETGDGPIRLDMTLPRFYLKTQAIEVELQNVHLRKFAPGRPRVGTAEPTHPSGPGALFNHLEGYLRVQGDIAAFNDILSLFQQHGAAQTLDRLRRAQVLVGEDDNLRLDAVAHNGALMINGQDFTDRVLPQAQLPE